MAIVEYSVGETEIVITQGCGRLTRLLKTSKMVVLPVPGVGSVHFTFDHATGKISGQAGDKVYTVK